MHLRGPVSDLSQWDSGNQVITLWKRFTRSHIQAVTSSYQQVQWRVAVSVLSQWDSGNQVMNMWWHSTRSLFLMLVVSLSKADKLHIHIQLVLSSSKHGSKGALLPGNNQQDSLAKPEKIDTDWRDVWGSIGSRCGSEGIAGQHRRTLLCLE